MKDEALIKSTQYHAKTHKKLKTIYNDIRQDERWAGIGDYPLLELIVRTMKETGLKVTLNDCAKALQNCKDSEFIRITTKSELVQQLHRS